MTQDSWEIVAATLSAQMDAAPIQFFATFSRFEWAFGQEGDSFSLKPPSPGISWDKVGQAFGGKFYQLVRADVEASRIIADPPKAIENLAGLGFRFNATPPHCGDASAVFHALARIRNNFFHGWKTGLEADDRQHIADGNAVLRITYEFCNNHPKHQIVSHHLMYV
ncbi:hypothetical protein [Rhizobium leguminosarum]|uniref:hypothetical protein n=1 Tax=Rhizobium leguminosarum TaxID=384 RepID=UPI00103B4F45|nr:hypothetical protein [Rhizobium leguminosarum]MBB4339860.1 hypothetical protein [Rhizobium leguminosarum]MBB6292920.1 hypothetical protein [Rhizobium leguminosarum]TCA47798.1 hypothetical protein E0H71_31700 [Rhizobium leguminosarum bv. viciae]